ncbi:DNA primase [Hyphomicrobium sp. D-2]|uniref:DNA primase n=1 Tax=Hyphomicrobium sp. D-2 TaxID=3041621 RepID=UPI0024574BEF|nr:DNA primase [Hyphomicrobium sp. D-2]MDH4981756.1 DNA primase [Hyphomicrobium sp. D-2]
MRTPSSRNLAGVEMRYPPNFLDEIRARISVSSVVGRKVALKRAGREFKGLSPFKVEKTPSFTVNDQKGFYHCFATGEHGDVFTFLMKAEGLSFPEAVERLAEQAGVPMPKVSARDEAREDARERLLKLVEMSAAFFQNALTSGAGSEARRYIEKRGLSRPTVATFRLGYAPNSKSALREHLAQAGFTVEEMISSGMLIGGDDIPVAYDRFRNRLMFPIQDLRGRTIAFGGRALDPDAPAKYLNSPETPLFHKGHNLFNAHRARGPAHDKSRIIAVEGYMDVIALAEAGFDETVAPLGTALTDDQLKLLWRMAEEPVLCFDGDAAGQKAAFRAVETALPLLKPGQSIRFAFLPGGLDPDDLIRQKGPEAFLEEISRTRALFDVLWERETKGQDISTPEQRAALEARLNALVGKIEDTTVRAHYEREMRETLWAMNRTVVRQIARGEGPRRSPAGGMRRNNTAPDWRLRERARLGQMPPRGGNAPRPVTASPELAMRAELAPPREALILKTLLNHPWLIDEHAEEIAQITFASDAMGKLRNGILAVQAVQNELDSAGLRSQLSVTGLDRVVNLVERSVTHRSDRFAEPNAPQAEVEDGWRHALALHERQVGLQKSLEAAVQAYHRDGSEDALARICEIQGLLARASEEALSAD